MLGIIVGLLAAAGVLWGMGYGINEMHPLPAGLDQFSPPRAWTKYLEAAPPGALWMLAGAGAAAALIGGWIAAAIARGHRGAAALVIAVPLTVAYILAAAFVPQPDWIPVLGMLLPIPLAVAAWRLAIPRHEL